MKNLNYLNYALIAIPFLLIGLGWLFESGIIIAGILFTLITGAFQVITGIGLFIESGYSDAYTGIYIIGVAVFFALWIFAAQAWMIAIPPILALYISGIIYIKAKNEKS
ncbi:hypothetical protein [uncultured Flavobacterium sp.]|uniref:hypothetical protein n=1 Tax=uncultured Flavobacterium sp. TaxID=165435 RepID=UPI0025E28A81|nr:hypothetical protein [uncultured Flavobacterium sp.]